MDYDLNAEGNPLAVIAGFGFTRYTEEVDQEVMSFDEAMTIIKEFFLDYSNSTQISNQILVRQTAFSKHLEQLFFPME